MRTIVGEAADPATAGLPGSIRRHYPVSGKRTTKGPILTCRCGQSGPEEWLDGHALAELAVEMDVALRVLGVDPARTW